MSFRPTVSRGLRLLEAFRTFIEWTPRLPEIPALDVSLADPLPRLFARVLVFLTSSSEVSEVLDEELSSGDSWSQGMKLLVDVGTAVLDGTLIPISLLLDVLLSILEKRTLWDGRG